MAEFIQCMTNASLYDGAFDSTVGWAAAGMGDAVITENGRMIVIDGGFPEDAPELVALLKERSAGEMVKVDLWIITHPHGDHYGALQEIARNDVLRDQVEIAEILYWFPEEFCGRSGEPNVLRNDSDILLEICRMTHAKPHTPERDEMRMLDDITLRFLYVPDDCSVINTGGGNANMCSLIFTVEGKRQKVLVTGDAYGRSMQITAWRYAQALKCDVLQMPHHALCDAYCVDFYRFADPRTVLMPVSVAGYRAMHSGLYEREEGCIANLCVEAKADLVVKAFEGMAILPI